MLPDVSGISPLEDGLLTFTRNGNNFEIKANGEVTPADFEDLYGTSGHYQALVEIYSSDGDLESGPQQFAIELYYERSAYFDDVDERTADQRFTFTEPFETYEGPAAGDELTINWSAPIAGSRSWGAGNPAGGIGCRDNAKTITPHDWSSTGNQDAAQFDAPASTTGKNGTINPTFTKAPDFENPVDHDGDNTYLVRFYNTHNLHNPSPESTIPSCSGSAVDLQIKVKDVGTPAPVTPTGSFSETDQSEVNLSWDAPTQFIEDEDEGGAAVDFPHPAFKPSAYDYRHRPTSSGSWTQVTGATSTSATINGLTTHTLQVQVRATNSEGSSPWPDDFVTITRLPQASISAVNSSITEGSRAQFQVNLDRGSSLTVNLTYSWLGGHGSTTGGTVTFSDSNSQALSLPTTSTGTAGSITVTVASGTGYTIGSPSSDTVTINRQTTPPSTPAAPSLTPLSSTAIRALWQEPTSQQDITSYTVRYSVADANDWTEQTITGTTADITGLTVNTAYDVQVKAHNSDGASSWSSTATASTKTLTATITSDQASLTEGNPASFTVSLSREETVTVALEYAWSGSHGSSTGDSITFFASDGETISIPTTATGSNGSITVAIGTNTAYTIGSPSSATATINRQTTPPSTPDAPSLTPLSSTAIRASWQEPTSQKQITSYTLSHSIGRCQRLDRADHHRDHRRYHRSHRRHRLRC